MPQYGTVLSLTHCAISSIKMNHSYHGAFYIDTNSIDEAQQWRIAMHKACDMPLWFHGERNMRSASSPMVPTTTATTATTSGGGGGSSSSSSGTTSQSSPLLKRSISNMSKTTFQLPRLVRKQSYERTATMLLDAKSPRPPLMSPLREAPGHPEVWRGGAPGTLQVLSSTHSEHCLS